MKKLTKKDTCLMYKPVKDVNLPITDVVDEGMCVAILYKGAFVGLLFNEAGQELLAEFKELTK